MSVLLDTNILTRSAQPAHPMQKTALDAVSILKTRGEDLCIVAGLSGVSAGPEHP